MAALTGIDAGAGPFATGDVAWLHRIWQVPLWALDDDDLMLLVGRGKGMPYVAALACDRLMEDPLRGGRSGAGALLLAVAALPDSVFAEAPHLAALLARFVHDAQALSATGARDISASQYAALDEELTLAAERAAAMPKAEERERRMTKRVQTYTHGDTTVTFDPNLCIHAAECVRGAPEVFRPRELRWVQLAKGDLTKVAAAVHRCPTGALQMLGPNAVPPDTEPTLRVVPDGPLEVRGPYRLIADDGTETDGPARASLCRCGRSGNKPYCDGSHRG